MIAKFTVKNQSNLSSEISQIYYQKSAKLYNNNNNKSLLSAK